MRFNVEGLKYFKNIFEILKPNLSKRHQIGNEREDILQVVHDLMIGRNRAIDHFRQVGVNLLQLLQ